VIRKKQNLKNEYEDNIKRKSSIQEMKFKCWRGPTLWKNRKSQIKKKTYQPQKKPCHAQSPTSICRKQNEVHQSLKED
jgi:hypothetical protein